MSEENALTILSVRGLLSKKFHIAAYTYVDIKSLLPYSYKLTDIGGLLAMAGKDVKERIAVIDAKIARKKEEIAALEAKKEDLLHPLTMRTVLGKAKEAGLTAREVAEKLGLEI